MARRQHARVMEQGIDASRDGVIGKCTFGALFPEPRTYSDTSAPVLKLSAALLVLQCARRNSGTTLPCGYAKPLTDLELS
jgi:hypothetical protein